MVRGGSRKSSLYRSWAGRQEVLTHDYILFSPQNSFRGAWKRCTLYECPLGSCEAVATTGDISLRAYFDDITLRANTGRVATGKQTRL